MKNDFTVIRYIPKGTHNALYYGSEPQYKDGDIIIRARCCSTGLVFDSESEVKEGLLSSFYTIEGNPNLFAYIHNWDGWTKDFVLSELHHKDEAPKEKDYEILERVHRTDYLTAKEPEITITIKKVKSLISNLIWEVGQETNKGKIIKFDTMKFKNKEVLMVFCENETWNVELSELRIADDIINHKAQIQEQFANLQNKIVPKEQPKPEKDYEILEFVANDTIHLKNNEGTFGRNKETEDYLLAHNVAIHKVLCKTTGLTWEIGGIASCLEVNEKKYINISIKRFQVDDGQMYVWVNECGNRTLLYNLKVADHVTDLSIENRKLKEENQHLKKTLADYASQVELMNKMMNKLNIIRV